MPPPSAARPASAPWWQGLDPRVSLPARATLLFGGATLALVLGVAQLAGTLLRAQLERQLGAAFENHASQVADKLDRALYERYRALQFTASLPALRQAASTAAERHTILEALHDASPDYAWVGFADPAGTILAASQNLFTGEKLNESDWFRGARRQPFIGTVHASPELAAAVPSVGAEPPRFLDLGVPVNAPDGKFLGVLGAHLRWSWARDIQLSVIPESARRERLGVTVYTTASDVLLDSGSSGWSEPPEPPAGLASRPGTRGTLIERTSGGSIYLTGYARSRGFREYRGLGWLSVVRQPVADAFAPAQRLSRTITTFGLGLVAALCVVTWLVTARLERRFHAVALAADRIGSGDVLTLMPLPRDDSAFSKMCTALGDMVATFRTRQDTLEIENARLAARQSVESPTHVRPPR